MDATVATKDRPTVEYRLRADAWEQIVEELGWPSNLAAARDIGVSHTQVGRVLAGATPGERFMASLMARLPRPWRHEDVFELVEGGGH